MSTGTICGGQPLSAPFRSAGVSLLLRSEIDGRARLQYQRNLRGSRIIDPRFTLTGYVINDRATSIVCRVTKGTVVNGDILDLIADVNRNNLEFRVKSEPYRFRSSLGRLR
ncbi:MAG: hypothetical protein AB7O57_14715 [Hyphomicrobiaceae bacterium]